MTDAIRQRKAFAMGSTTPGYGEYHDKAVGRNPGYAKGGHVKHHVPTAGHHNMDGHIGKGAHGHNHKTHGHHVGVVHHKTGGVHQEPGGVGEGGETHGPKQSTGATGPSENQFGQGMPKGHGSSLGRW